MIIDSIPEVPGEQMIRSYEILDLDSRPRFSGLFGLSKGDFRNILLKNPRYSTEAKLIVTNKRVIYTAESKYDEKHKATHYHQISIADVGDISIMDTVWFKILGPILLIILGIILIGSVGVLLIVAGVLLLVWRYLNRNRFTYVSVASKANGRGIYVGRVGSETVGDLFFRIYPGKDFSRMANELGALIIDLQTNGDSCLERWL